MMNREAELSSRAIAAQSPHRLPADGQEQLASIREAEVPKKTQDTLFLQMAARPSSPVTEWDCKSNSGADTSDSPVPSGTPPYTKWAEGLHNLLEDHDGVKLFGQYLKEEVQDTSSLDFLLACQGIRNQVDPNLKLNMIKVLYRNYVRASSSKLGIRPETKDVIDSKMSNKTELDETVFDAACKDVEFRMVKTTYPNFLRSDIYIQFVQMAQEGCRTPDRVSFPDSDSSVSCLSDSEPPRIDMLPVVFEESELEQSVCNRFSISETVALPTRRLMSHLCRAKSENKAG